MHPCPPTSLILSTRRDQSRPRPKVHPVFAVLALACAGAAGCAEEEVAQVVVKLRLAPDAMAFGELPVGARQPRTFAIINDGNGPYAPSTAPFLDGAAADSFAVLTPCALPLAPGAFCNVEVAFEPIAEGLQAATLVVEPPPDQPAVDFGTDGIFGVDLQGTGTPAEVLVAPAQLDFGALQVGTSSRRSFTVENRGEDELDLPLVIDGEAFSVDGGQTSATVHLEPGAVVTIEVDFAPQRGGAFAATALLELCGAGCGPTVALTGVGEAPRIEVAPRTVDFGEVAVGTSALVTLEVSNVGTGDLVLLQLDLLTPTSDLALDDAPVLPVTIDAPLTVAIRYSPTSARGALDATLRIRSSDPVSSDVLVPVTASAPGPALELLPRVASFGVLDEGDERLLDVVLRSIGTVPAEVTSVDVTGVGGHFDFDGPAPPIGALLPGDALLFRIRASANAAAVAAGGAEGAVVVTATGLGDLALPLAFFSGTSGCQPRAPLPNAALGAVVLGQGTTGVIALQNVGDAPCILDEATEPAGFPADPSFSFSTTQARNIAPGGFGEVDVAFDAEDVGQVSAFLSVAFTDAPGGPLLLSATARGVTGTVVGEPPVLEIGPITEGCPVDARFATFINRGSAPANIAALAVVPVSGTANPFTLDLPTLPTLLTPGAALPVPVEVVTSAATVGVHESEVQATVEEEGTATVRVVLTVQAPGAPVTESFEAADVRAVDVLFVVDNSGSMADDQQLLADNFTRFIETAFDDTSLRFHIGVTTTDVISGTGGPLVDSYLTDGLSQGSLETLFAEMALVGIEGDGRELGLEAMRRAIDDLANTVNAGFLRDEAALSVVIVSDEEDNGGDPTIDPALQRPVETYVEALSALKSNLANTPVLVSVVVQPGFSPRYETVANAFGGVILDITSPTWGEQLSTIGAATFGLQRLFRLGGPPEPGSVTVTVDGVATTAFTVDGNAVILDDAPDPGALIEITYVAGCT